MQTHDGLQERQNATPGRSTPVLPTSSCAQAEDGSPEPSKPVLQPRGENIPQGSRLSARHSVFVLACDGTPLTPTTPAKAKKLLRAGVAKKVWSKFGTFGIQLLHETRRETPKTSLGVDYGTKFEGYSVVVDKENNLNIKLDLPDKKPVARKMEDRRRARKARRFRNCRRRPCRQKNRNREGYIAPSQKIIVDSRLKIIREFCRIYPVIIAAIEDIKFNHKKNRWGRNFSTMEIGKNRIRGFFKERNISIREFKGYETKDLRELYGYQKTYDKSLNCFESHCSDSLSLALAVGIDAGIDPGPFLVVDDTYRPVRRRLHDAQPAKGGVRELYSTGIVRGLRKGLLVGTGYGPGRLCGTRDGSFRYYDKNGERRQSVGFLWISNSFVTRSIDLPKKGSLN